jgi:hypothetical protein
MTKAQIEKRWGVKIVEDGYTYRGDKVYRMYSADGCPWEKGIRTIAGCERECREWDAQLTAIKKQVEEVRRKSIQLVHPKAM